MRRISQKLWLAVMTLIVSIIVLVWVFQVGLLREFYIEERKEALLERAIYLADVLMIWDQNTPPPSEATIVINELFGTYDTRVMILDSNDRIMMHPGVLPVDIRNIDIDRFIKNLKPLDLNVTNILERAKSRSRSQSTFGMIDNNVPPKGSMLVTAPIYLGNTYRGKVVLFMPMAPIDETAAILQRQLTTISFISIVIGSLLAFLMSRQFTQPILNIRNATKRIASGDFNIKLRSKSKDEVGELATDINDMARKLGETDQERKDFVANVSHDLKTPITLIQTYTEFLIEKSRDLPEDDKEYLQVIYDEAHRLDHIVDDLLYLSRIEARNPDMKYCACFIEELVDATIKSLNCLIDEKAIKVVRTSIGDPREVLADKQKLQRVLFNLIHNAIVHAEGLNSIKLIVEYTPSGFKFSIHDNGHGISEADLPHVWDRFYRADKSRTTIDNEANTRTGIGMAIVKQILLNHNYDFGIESQIGTGTRVWFEGAYK